MTVYTINNPKTGDDRDFKNLREARAFAKRQNYTPVIIDRRRPDGDLDDWYITVINRGKEEIL